MIFSFIPALLGVGKAAPPETPTRAAGEPQPRDGVRGFETLLLALLGGGHPEEAAGSTSTAAESGTSDLSPEGDWAEGAEDRPAESSSGSGPGLTTTVGRTTPAGWATLTAERVSTYADPTSLDPRVELDVRAVRAGRLDAAAEKAVVVRPGTSAAAVAPRAIVNLDNVVEDRAVVDPRPARDLPKVKELRGVTTAEGGIGEGIEVAQAVDESIAEGAEAPTIVDDVAALEPPADGEYAVSVAEVEAARDPAPIETPDTGSFVIDSGDGEYPDAPGLDERAELRESSSDALSDAASQSLAATAVVGPADVRTPDRSSAHIDPELRDKVERVIERMSAEYGYTVRMVEGYRSPERQRHLFAQGRSRPGPVVTWTRNSLHSEGRAVDLKVDGKWNQRAAYAALQKIAQEEGLGTLGMKDPGHLELRLDGEPANAATSSDPAEVGEPAEEAAPAPQRSAPRPRVARGIDVAEPARVARVARPARVATVASARIRPEAPRTPDAVKQPVLSEDSRVRLADAAEPSRRKEPSTVSDPRPEQGLPPAARSAVQTSSAPVTEVLGATGPDVMGRVHQVEQARDTFAGLAPQRVSLHLDGTAGPVERIRVDMLDQALRGDVQVNDPVLAARLRDDAGELMRTLQDRGYDPQSLTVNQVRGASDLFRDGLAGSLRAESAVEALKSLMETQGGNPGRDAHHRQGGDARQNSQDRAREGFNQQSRRDDRRQTR